MYTAQLAGLVAGAAIGASVGAFAATAAIRLSAGRNPWHGRSCCDGCDRQLSVVETLPLLSYALLRGRCRTCDTRIDGLHPLSELLGATIVPLCLYLASGVDGILLAALAAFLLTTAIVDLRTLRLLDVFTLSIAVLAAILAWREHVLLQGGIAAVLGGACLYGLKRFLEQKQRKPMLGLGDIKLTMALALCLGDKLPLMLAFAAGLGLCWVLLSRQKRLLPFGPMLAIASLCLVCINYYAMNGVGRF